MIATIRPDRLLAKTGETGSLLDLAQRLPGFRVPEVLAGLLRDDPAMLGIDLSQPVHLFVEGGADGNTSDPSYFCVTATVNDFNTVNGHTSNFALLGMKQEIENDLTVCSFSQPTLAFGFNKKHFALVLGLRKGIETTTAIDRVRLFFLQGGALNEALGEHLSRPFDVGLYLRPGGSHLVPDLFARGGPVKLTPTLTTTSIRFEPEKLLIHFNRIGANERASPPDRSVHEPVPLPSPPPEAAASVAIALEDNGSTSIAAHLMDGLLHSLLDSHYKVINQDNNTLAKNQWLGTWSGGTGGGGAYAATIIQQGATEDANKTKTAGSKKDLHAQLNRIKFKAELDCRKANALLRLTPKPKTWRYDLVATLEKVDRLSWSGTLAESTLEVTLRGAGRNSLASLLEFSRKQQADRQGSELYEAIRDDDMDALVQAMENIAPDLFDPGRGVSPFHFAARKGRQNMLEYFLEKGMEVDSPDADGRTALQVACWSGKKEPVVYLLTQGASANARNIKGTTPAMTAAQIGNREVLLILLDQGADLNATDNNGNGLIEYAAASGRDTIVQLLKEHNASTRNPLQVAAGINDVDQLKSLLEAGRDVNERDGWGGTALLFAASAGNIEALSLLLEKEADTEISDNLGFTLVHAAAVSGNEKVMKRVLDLNPKINPRHKDHNKTPLDWALATGDQILSEMLRRKGGKTSWALGSP